MRLELVRCLLLVGAALAFACDSRAPGPSSSASPPRPATAPQVASGSSPAPSSQRTAAAKTASPVLQHGISWYRDDANAALSKARELQRPLVVDLWAPWCHTCLSMQHAVLTAEKLPNVQNDFVFLAIDTELEKNAEFLLRYPVGVWPTFYVLDAASGAIAGRWLGAASPAQFLGFLKDGQRAVKLLRTAANVEDPLKLLAAGDALTAQRNFVGAAEKYQKALAQGDRGWARRPDVLVALASALAKAKAFGKCADLAQASLGEVGNGISAADFSSTAITCVDALPAADVRVRSVRLAVEKRLSAICHQGSPELTADDRGDACGSLRRVRLRLGDTKGAERALRERLAVLEAAAEGAPDEVLLTYDFARSDSLVELGRGNEAIELLLRREKALPHNYNPPHHLARVYSKLERWDEGLSAIERALAKAYGPRRASLMTLKVDLLLGKGRTAEARNTLKEQLAAFRSLPPGQRQSAAEERVAARLAELKESTDKPR